MSETVQILLWALGTACAVIAALSTAIVRLAWTRCNARHEELERRLAEGDARMDALSRAAAWQVRAMERVCREVTGDCGDLSQDGQRIVEELVSLPGRALHE